MLCTNIVNKGYQRYLTLLLLALSVHACGFQLRGELEISEDMSPLYLQQNSAFDLAREIKQLLASNKIEVTENVNQANSQLILLNEYRNRRVLSVDSDGRAREYQLSYAVNFSIRYKNSEGQLSDEIPETISVKRTLLFDQDAVLAVTNESEILYRDMRRDVSRLVLLKMQAHSKELDAAEVMNLPEAKSVQKSSSTPKSNAQ